MNSQETSSKTSEYAQTHRDSETERGTDIIERQGRLLNVHGNFLASCVHVQYFLTHTAAASNSGPLFSAEVIVWLRIKLLLTEDELNNLAQLVLLVFTKKLLCLVGSNIVVRIAIIQFIFSFVYVIRIVRLLIFISSLKERTEFS